MRTEIVLAGPQIPTLGRCVWPGPRVVHSAFHCVWHYKSSQGTRHSSLLSSKTWKRLNLLWQRSYKVWRQLQSVDVCPSFCSLWKAVHIAKERLHSLTHASFPFIFRNTSAGCRYHARLPPQLWGISVFWREKSYFRIIFLPLISELWQGPHSNTF